MLAVSEESHLRDLSPETTLRAFTVEPVPFDITRDEYKIFACIDSLTAAERDLGARVAKAAQRLKSWCSEIEQWGWTGTFEQPSEEYKEQRRRSLEARIAEHVGNADALAPLEYCGSLLSVEVEQHEVRLDDMSEELLKLDVDELKEYVLDMHPQGRSRPGSAGFGASRSNYQPMDDFSFLITQTLLSALPHHAQLKERLNTWTARVSILRSAPRYLNDLQQAQKAMKPCRRPQTIRILPSTSGRRPSIPYQACCRAKSVTWVAVWTGCWIHWKAVTIACQTVGSTRSRP
jgi:hypothetical protein